MFKMFSHKMFMQGVLFRFFDLCGPLSNGVLNSMNCVDKVLKISDMRQNTHGNLQYRLF